MCPVIVISQDKPKVLSSLHFSSFSYTIIELSSSKYSRESIIPKNQLSEHQKSISSMFKPG